jgi:PII-like signaling protein
MKTRYTSDVAQLLRYARSFFEKHFRQREKSNRLAIPIPMVVIVISIAREVARFVSALRARSAFPFSRQ